MDSKSPRSIAEAGDDLQSATRIAADVHAGLTLPLKTIPCKYLYDDRGSRLFEEICLQPEYYQTRTEEKILERVAADVTARTRAAELVELGSGAGRKVRCLLDAMRRAGTLRGCALLDINETVLAASVERLGAAYPEATVRGVHADFMEEIAPLRASGGDRGERRLVVFLAGTIGNLHPSEVPAFLARIGASLEPGDGFLVGLDLVKEKARLDAAYNDARGVTAEFIRNVLVVMNRELGADFDPSAFEYVAWYDAANAWVDIRLRSRRAQRVRIPGASLVVDFAAGEDIRAEISCKYTRASFERLLPGTGFSPRAFYSDAENLFALALLELETTELKR
jgi:L-histidine N-alpha-methyltransferase